MSRPNIFPFQLKLWVNECHFGLPQLWAVIHLTLSMRIVIVLQAGFWCKCALLKWIGLLLTIMASQNGIHSALIEAEKGKFWIILDLDIVSQNVPSKKNHWTKLADLGIIFLRRSYFILWYQSLYPHIVGSMPFRFFWATLYSRTDTFAILD